MRKIAILTYTTPHRKTYDTLCLLKARGYEDVRIYGQQMTYVKKRQPLVKHRPELGFSIPDTSTLSNNLGYQYIEGGFDRTIGSAYDKDEVLYLLCGAGLLADTFINSHRIVNSHPGYTPFARGLDAYKWSVWYKLPIGVTTHFLGDYVDAGEVIERRVVKIGVFDSFHSVAQRIYENEIDMLVGAIEKVDNEHELIVPDSDSVIN